MKKIGILLLLFITSNLIAQNNSKDETEITKLIQSISETPSIDYRTLFNFVEPGN